MRFMAQPHRVGFRNFASGISHLRQRSGRENRDLERLILPAIVGAEDVDPRVFKCVRALLDFIFKAMLPLHTEATLRAMEGDLAAFFANLQVFIDIGARLNKRGEIIDHFCIPKLHLLLHYTSNIRDLGTTDNYSTEICETLHIPYCKEAYRHTNRKDYDSQIIKYLKRTEALQEYVAYLGWRRQQYPAHENSPDDYDPIDGEEDVIVTEEDRNILRSLGLQGISAIVGSNGSNRELERTIPSESPHMYCPRLTCSPKPHSPYQRIDSVMERYNIPSLHSSITLFHKNGKSGAYRHRDDWARQNLPAEYEEIDVWNFINCTRPALNEFHPSEERRLRCAFNKTTNQLYFDPVLVEVTSPRGSNQVRVADLRLIFRSSSRGENKHLAFVHWYETHSTPHPHHRLRTVRKMMRGGERAGGVVLLSAIRGACPLSPHVVGLCPPGLNSSTVYENISSFFINPFASHLDYDLFE
ncbi:hypothetical protein DL93DRAFT_2092352 [Clavulina sp. PMI_390]|nr:hypothetical protein DL93DRAFT_2092352 [Clavulina sp. PMI_390]